MKGFWYVGRRTGNDSRLLESRDERLPSRGVVSQSLVRLSRRLRWGGDGRTEGVVPSTAWTRSPGSGRVGLWKVEK